MSEQNKGRGRADYDRIARRAVLTRLAALPPLALLGGMTSACESLVPGQTPPPSLYRLTPKSSFKDSMPAVDWQLVLEAPLADAGLNTTRIALQRSPMQLEYYARSGWTDRAPLMIQTLMIESFENSGRIIAVGRETVGLRADYVLKTELREFQAEYFAGGPPQVRVSMNAKLVKMPNRIIVASESWEHVIDATADRIGDVIQAFDDALGKVLKRMVEWTLTEGQGSLRSS